jgi:hypothetical protein
MRIIVPTPPAIPSRDAAPKGCIPHTKRTTPIWQGVFAANQTYHICISWFASQVNAVAKLWEIATINDSHRLGAEFRRAIGKVRALARLPAVESSSSIRGLLNQGISGNVNV